MRAALTFPSPLGRLRAPAYTPDAIASRERFVRAAAEAWARAGDAGTSARLRDAADALAIRFPGDRAPARS